MTCVLLGLLTGYYRETYLVANRCWLYYGCAQHPLYLRLTLVAFVAVITTTVAETTLRFPLRFDFLQPVALARTAVGAYPTCRVIATI